MASAKGNYQQCSLCLNLHSSPRMLPCFHTFCLACLQRLIHTRNYIGTFPCPTCRSITQIPQGGVDRFQGNDIETAIQTLQISQRFAVTCNICAMQAATSKCVECDQFACNSCTAAHSKICATRSHTVLIFNSVSEGTPHVVKERLCATHKDEKVRFYCYLCHCLLCRDCKLTAHEGHPAGDISERSEAAKRMLLRVAEKCRILAPQLNTSLQKAEKHQADLAKTESEIFSTLRQRDDEIRGTVDSCLKQAEAKLAGQSADLQKQVSETIEEMQQQIVCFENFAVHAEQVMRAGCDADILDLPKEISTYFGCDLLSTQGQGGRPKGRLVLPGRKNAQFEAFINETWLQTIKLAGSQSTGQDYYLGYQGSYQPCNQKRGHLKELITEKLGITKIAKGQSQTSHSQRQTPGQDRQQSEAATISQAIADIQGYILRWATPRSAQPANARWAQPYQPAFGGWPF